MFDNRRMDNCNQIINEKTNKKIFGCLSLVTIFKTKRANSQKLLFVCNFFVIKKNVDLTPWLYWGAK